MSTISKLIEELIDNTELYTKVYTKEMHDLMYRAAYTIEMLSEKAIEPKQGEWINKGAVCQCTRCKGYSRGLLEEKNGKLCEPHKLIYPQFCPNCGARMKGADDE